MAHHRSPGTSRKRLSRRAIDEIASRKDDHVITECGCMVIPEVTTKMIGGGKAAECGRHGFQKIIRAAKPREVTNELLGRPRDYQNVLPDEPPF